MFRIKHIRFPMFLLLLLFISALPAFAAPTYSDYWAEDASGNWHIYDENGTLVRNAWVCDDAVSSNGKDIWYLIDADGNMISAGLVQDGTGNYYSLEMNHDGYYGMLRYESKSYTADGLTVSLQLVSSHDGSFAAIQNEDGIKALKAKYGLKKVTIDNSSCIYTSAFSAGQTSTQKADHDATGQEDTGENSSSQNAEAGTGSTLTEGDFLVTGSSVPQNNMITYIASNYGSDSAAFFYYDSASDPSRSSVVKTARGITLASYKKDVLKAYGEGIAVDTSSPASTRALDVVYRFDPNGLKTYAKSCLAYFTEDEACGIYFCFKDNGQLSYIIYYCA